MPIGLTKKLIRFATEGNYTFYIDFLLEREVNVDKLVDFVDNIPDKPWDPYDFQVESFIDAIKSRNMCIISKTGSGKSFCIFFLLNFMLACNKTSLLLVSKLGLIAQMQKDLISYGMDASLIKCIHGETDKLFNGKVNISTWQSIYKMTEGELDIFDCVICDEVHEAKATSISSILSKLKHAEYRIGTTGTLPKNNTADYYTIIGNLGEPKLYRTYEELKGDGILSPIMVNRHILMYPEYEKEHCYNELRKDYWAEIDYLMAHDNRNNYIVNLIKDNCSNGNTLVLFQYIEKHGKVLLDLFKQRLPEKKIIYIDGKVKIDDREIAREIAEAQSNVVILASYGVFAVGVNIKNLHNIIFASSTKSFTRVCQSIGRGLRTHQSKEILNVYDLIDDLSFKEDKRHYDNYLLGHGKDRLKIYQNEGFPTQNLQISLF